MDMLLNLNSIKLLKISEDFMQFPDNEVLCNEFLDIMQSAFSDCQIRDRDDFTQQLVDLFFRCKKMTSKKLKFDELTAYLIEHEISTQKSGTHSNVNMQYVESDLRDTKTHNQFIEKIFYFPQIDKVILYE